MPELNDSLAWMVALGAGVLVLVCMWLLTRNLNWWWLKWVLRVVPPVALLLPASVPNEPGFYAPAFVVAPFEAFLQENGDPRAAVSRLVLVLGALVGLITLAAIARWLRSRNESPATSDSAQGDNQAVAGPG